MQKQMSEKTYTEIAEALREAAAHGEWTVEVLSENDRVRQEPDGTSGACPRRQRAGAGRRMTPERIDRLKARCESVANGTWHGPIATTNDLRELLTSLDQCDEQISAFIVDNARLRAVLVEIAAKVETQEQFVERTNETSSSLRAVALVPCFRHGPSAILHSRSDDSLDTMGLLGVVLDRMGLGVDG